MKGISLAVETIIILVIAVAILAVLALFLHGIAGEGGSQLTLERNRQSMCSEYAQLDPDCDAETADAAGIKNIWSGGDPNLRSVCERLQVEYCVDGSGKGKTSSDPKENRNCIKRCCSHVCPQDIIK